MANEGDEENSSLNEIEFNDVVEEVRKKFRIRMLQMQRGSRSARSKEALRFLDQLNSESDKMKKKFPDFQKFRNSEDFQIY